MHPSPQNNARFHAAGLFVILLFVVLCVWPAMRSPLFSDDIHQLDKSSNFVKWTEIFNPDVFGFYRPVKNLLFMLLAPVSENLLAWHMVGLVAFLAATVGIYRIAYICLDSRRAAWLATALWALSPSCVSTAVWLSCANISIGLVFTSLVFHFHERWVVRSSPAAIVACGFFYGMSLLCYETLIAAPALLFIRDFQMRRLAFDRRTVARYALYTLVALAFLLVRHHFSARNIGDVAHRIGFTEGTTGIHLSLSAPWFLWRHFLMWAFPFGQLEILGNYGWMRSASLTVIIMSWVFLVALLTTAALTWKRFPAVGYGILFFIVASIPSGNFIPCFNGPINDAYVTIPSIGLAIALASACDILYKQFLMRRNGLKSGALAFAAVLAVLLIYRLPVGAAYFRYWAGVWNNPAELMLLTSEVRPYLYQPRAFASVLLYSGGYVDHAETIATQALEENPGNNTARLTLARVAVFRKDTAGAEQYYGSVISSPGIHKFLREPALLELAEMLAENPERQNDAVLLFREFLKGSRNNHQAGAIAKLSELYRKQGNAPKARATVERGLSMYPGAGELKKQLASLGVSVPESLPQKN